MPVNIPKNRQARRSIGFVLLGILLLGFAGWLGYMLYVQKVSSIDNPTSHDYDVTQSVSSQVKYLDSSFYEDGSQSNTAYLLDLTDVVEANFDYNFKSSRPADVTYDYDITAKVRGSYSLEGDEKSSDVWTKDFVLKSTERRQLTADNFDIEEKVEIPVAEYRKLIDDFKNTLGVPIGGEVVTTLRVYASG